MSLRCGLVALTFLALLLMVAGCDGYENHATHAEKEYTNENQSRLIAAVPPPILTDSLERRNLVRRYQVMNNPSKVSWIALVSYGKVMATYTIKGKVSSVSSQLTCPQQVVYMGSNAVPIDMAEPDGSYGTNGEAIFFFTPEGAYKEWRGEYLVSDQPFVLQTPPQIVAAVNLEKAGK